MNMTDCEQIEEQLPLLRYADELSPEERVELLAHLEGCAGCRRARDEVEAAAASLDVVPLERPDPQRYRTLKDRVLETVRGDDTFTDEELSEQDVTRVGWALDLVEVEYPAGGLGGLSEQILARVADESRRAESEEQPAPAGRLLKLNWSRVVAVAAVFAAAVGLGLLSAQSGDPKLGAKDVLALKQGADRLLLSHEVGLAERQYRLVETLGADLPDAERTVADARAEREAIVAYAALASADLPDQLQGYQDLVREQPERICSILALEDMGRGTTAPATTVFDQLNPNVRPTTRVNLPPRHNRGFRYQDTSFASLADDLERIIDPHQRQAVLLQLGIRAEEWGNLTDARHLYQQTIELIPDSRAAEVARERLSLLG
jgi:Putative zinc-finger